MAPNYRKQLFDTYYSTHAASFDQDEQEKLVWSRLYIQENYLHHLAAFDRARGALLEIGCSKGYFLKGFQSLGFEQLSGVDLSPEDVANAQRIVPGVEVVHQEAREYLVQRADRFDAILMKAVLEHIPKEEVLPLLQAMKTSLRAGGMVLIDVPNMDWLFASHERYMDFTHETGFTRESLRQVMNNAFEAVEIFPVDHIFHTDKITALKKKIGRKFMQMCLEWADPQGAQNPIWARNILGIGWKS